MGVSGQLHALAALPPGEKASGIHWIRSWGGHFPDLVGNRTADGSPPRRLVTILTELPRLPTFRNCELHSGFIVAIQTSHHSVPAHTT
jgi:hypothetical protein